jgi:two-component system chemotaxis sensor kinase CheA
MHTIKGSSAMMEYSSISALSHSVEDLFCFIREANPSLVNFSQLTDLVLKSADFIKAEIGKIQDGGKTDTDSNFLIDEINAFLENLKKNSSCVLSNSAGPRVNFYGTEKGNLEEVNAKKTYKAVLCFEDDCKMENIRAIAVIQNIKDYAAEIFYSPSNINDDNESAEIIRIDGFKIYFKTDCNIDTVRDILSQTIFLKSLSLDELDSDDEIAEIKNCGCINSKPSINKNIQLKSKSINQKMISVNISKLDSLMDLVGELVISESMLTNNLNLQGRQLDYFNKAARQHRKIINTLQDIVMSIRMVSLSATFQKMNRIVRDAGKALNKNIRLVTVGEDTEVDKNIVEHISDPLMHIIRNAADHGIETVQERVHKNKEETGTITLEAKKSGGDVLIIVRDDGRGLDKNKILQKAKKNGLLKKPESSLTDREIYSFIYLPGFSTCEKVSEFSGRGVGMDVVIKNIGKIGGSVNVDSVAGEGTVVTIKIPLTLAIMNGMIVKVGSSTYTIPIVNIVESFIRREEDIITDPDGNELILIRGECYPVLRLYKHFGVETKKQSVSEGIIMMVENEDKRMCILVDELIGEQQVVVKALPYYIKNFKYAKGIEGCTLLSDGSISLILDVSELLNSYNGREMTACQA